LNDSWPFNREEIEEWLNEAKRMGFTTVNGLDNSLAKNAKELIFTRSIQDSYLSHIKAQLQLALMRLQLCRILFLCHKKCKTGNTNIVGFEGYSVN